MHIRSMYNIMHITSCFFMFFFHSLNCPLIKVSSVNFCNSLIFWNTSPDQSMWPSLSLLIIFLLQSILLAVSMILFVLFGFFYTKYLFLYFHFYFLWPLLIKYLCAFRLYLSLVLLLSSLGLYLFIRIVSSFTLKFINT